MIGLVLIAHAPLASALRDCARHVYSCDAEAYARLRVLDVAPDADFEATVTAARALLAEVNAGAGVLVLADAFGATPGNVAARLAEPGRVAVVAGANLPMLLRALCYRSAQLADLVDKAVAGGQQGVMQVAATPVQNQGYKPTANDQGRLHHQQ
jgi:PTS system ascorbate-specific IIA component